MLLERLLDLTCMVTGLSTKLATGTLLVATTVLALFPGSPPHMTMFCHHRAGGEPGNDRGYYCVMSQKCSRNNKACTGLNPSPAPKYIHGGEEFLKQARTRLFSNPTHEPGNEDRQPVQYPTLTSGVSCLASLPGLHAQLCCYCKQQKLGVEAWE